MSHRQNTQAAKACPRTGKPVRKRRLPRWAIWLLPLIGLASAIWFLIRVVPKPSRATYPCQRLAAPLASSFVVWVTGILASAVAFQRAKHLIRRSRYVVATVAILVGLVGVYLAATNTPMEPAEAATEWYSRNDPLPNHPLTGVPQGIHPGRVVWVRDVDATDWDGTTGYWRDPGNTDPVVVDRMVSDAVRSLTGEQTDAAAWDALFRHRNQLMGKGDVGYDPDPVADERIAIKLNLVATGTPDGDGYQVQYLQYNSHSVEMIHALLRQLVEEAGVPQERIYIGDPTNMFPGQFLDYLTPDFPNVHYMTRIPLADRETVQFSSVRMHWSTSDADGKTPDYFTQYYANAEYFINFANFKAHWAGITMCGKNHYGSMTRRPDATAQGYYAMHDSLSYVTPDDSQYRALVDLLGHEVTGQRALLYMVDGLWGGYGWGGASPPVIWRSEPFNGDWPSSVFMSQDPMAIDSVGFDLWWEEDKVSWDYSPFNISNKAHFPHIRGSCDYLVEGSQAGGPPPSGTFYDPENDGSRMQSLGVHEHHDGQLGYSGPASGGIELVRPDQAPPVDVVGRHVFYNNSRFDGYDPGASAADDAAIAPDKTPLLPTPGAMAAFANYTTCDSGITGIIVDITNFPTLGDPTEAYVECRIGDGAIWSDGPMPATHVRPGEGVGGSDRITLIFPPGAVRDTWLEVTVLATPATGLRTADVFYIGNAPGDTGDSPDNTQVTTADVDNCANNPKNLNLEDFVALKQNFGATGVGFAGGDYDRNGTVALDDFVILKQCFGQAAAIDDPHDLNRDGRVDDADMDVAEDNPTGPATCLPLMAIPGPPVEIVLVDRGSVWKYLDDGSNLGTIWRDPIFPDALWLSGPAELGYGDGEATTVSYGTDAQNKHITTYFRHTFHLDDASAITSLTVEVLRDDAAVIYLNGDELARSNITGTVDHLTLADGAVANAAETTWYVYGNRDVGLLVDDENVLAVEIHQAGPTSSDISFNLKLYQPAQ